MQGRTEKLKGGANIDNNEVFCEILNKMSQKGGGRRTVAPTPSATTTDDMRDKH